MSDFYIRIYKNKMIVRNLDSKQEAAGAGQFSNQRILIADFLQAADLLSGLFQKATLSSRLFSFFKTGQTRIVVQAMEMNEGGLSPVEDRAIMEMTLFALRKKCRFLLVFDGNIPLKDHEVLTKMTTKKAAQAKNIAR